MPGSSELTFEDIERAAQRIVGKVRKTPVLVSRALNELAGKEIFFKCENFQDTGAFKQRGAMNAVYSLTDEECARGVVTHSSGNHGAALAFAASTRDCLAHVVMPSDTPKIKRDAVKRFGGRIVECAPGMQGRRDTLEKVIAETGANLVHPYNDYRIMAGQGTAALELIREVPELDAILVPIGGGGLISGSAVVTRHLLPSARVLGAEPARAADTATAFRGGEVNPVDNPDTIAEGLRALVGELNLAIIRRLVDDIYLVEESEIIDTMRLAWEHLKITIEASSAVAVAPLLQRSIEIPRRVGVILTGGNVDLDRLPWA